MKTLLLSAAAVAALAVLPPALAQTGQAPKAPVTRADIGAKIQRQFARLDANKDGIVTRAEAEAIAEERSERAGMRAEMRAKHRDPAAMFARLDSNKDGRITRAEAEAARTAIATGAGGKPANAHALAIGGLFDAADANRDGSVSRAEFDAAAALREQRRAKRMAMRGHGFGRMFAMADADKDGKVTQSEATAAALRHFDAADTNRDGTLSADEMRSARAGKH